ncbi:MAG TPA: penicillin acylase family protein [Caldimonas sp.]|jgi:penicillin amidase|nr:penicillin acylase family protein [Caldimonas sp.]HEX2541298.1 penicillin acylase family protein [Caldimonas sp.]
MAPTIRRRRALRWLAALLWLVLALVVAAIVGGWFFLRASLPALDGRVEAAGLRAPVSVSRDANGVPAIRGSDRTDIAWATGYVHAQERFFQMDLLRRAATGELSALIGKALLPVDRERRLHRFGARAGPALAALAEPDRAVIERYAAGVNAGLAALDARPFEYGVLRATPRPWRAEDSLLVAWAMYFDLQEEQMQRVLSRGWLRDHGTTPAQLAFLLPTASAHDAPLDAAAIDESPAPLPAEAPAWFAKAGRPKTAAAAAPVLAERVDALGEAAVGSNSWVLAGSRTKSGAAMVGNDMHLNLRLPHIWYRAAFEIEAAAGQPARRIVGVTLPGVPIVVAGSNGQVAWGMTNSYGAYLDLLELEFDAKDPLRYRLGNGPPAASGGGAGSGASGDGWGLLRTVEEWIAVAGAADDVLRVAETAYGPVWERGGRRYAMHWVAHDPGAVNLALLGLERAGSVAEALAVGQRSGVPAQNMVVGDAAGKIGWTLAGALPARAATWASTFPAPAASAASHTWSALAAPGAHPVLVDPAAGQIATANSRQLAGSGYAAIGDGGADLGARQRQVRDAVTALPAGSDEAAVYQVFLDDRALYLAPWRDRALQVLADPAAASGRRAEFRRLLESTWTGRASVDSVAYRLTRSFLGALYLRLFGGVDEELHAVDKAASFARATPRWPTVIARLLDEKPAAWLPKGSASWQAVQLAAIDDVIAELDKEGTPLEQATWGRRNTTRIAHPMASGLPFGTRWLAAPAEPLPGDRDMPRVAAPAFGQSERFVITPGREAEAVFNMPGGQSGHPLSRWFLAGHADWVAGRPTPLLPGEPVHTLAFVPR